MTKRIKIMYVKDLKESIKNFEEERDRLNEIIFKLNRELKELKE